MNRPAPAPGVAPDAPSCLPLREIGAGAYGTVHLARLGSAFVAVKSCRRPADPAGAVAFGRELRGVREYMGLPPHEGLVRVLHLEEEPGGDAFRYAMELADAEDGTPAAKLDDQAASVYRPRTLASVLDAEVALPLRECVALGLRLADALAFLQSHHLAHRDVKPSNVLYVRGRPVLADIGLVRDVREAASLVGTPGYAPPEAPGTPEGDVYGLGRTLWRAATGRTPDETGFVPCAEADVDAPLYWRFLAILQRACSADPDRRHRSAKALRRDLLRFRAALCAASVPVWLRAGAAALALFAAGYGLAAARLSPQVGRLAEETDARERAEWREKYLRRQLEAAEMRNREYRNELADIRAASDRPDVSSDPASPPEAEDAVVPALPPEEEDSIVSALEKNFSAISNFMERMIQPISSTPTVEKRNRQP